MNTRPSHTFHTFTVLAALTVGLAGAATAAPLTFNGVSPARAAAQLSARLGVQITLKNHFGSRVTFTVEDADAAGGRLQAVNAFANALGARFTKVYVVHPAEGADPGVGAVDSATKLPAVHRTLSAPDAIRLAAALDDAEARIIGDVSGTVTLPPTALTVAHAAAEVARQTDTRWLTVYELTAATQDAPRGGTVIGRTAGGSPIIEYAAVYFPSPKPAPPRPPVGGPAVGDRTPFGAAGAFPGADTAASTSPQSQQLLAQEQLLMQQQQQLLAQQQAFAQQQAQARSGYVISGGNAYRNGYGGGGFGSAVPAMRYPANGLLLQGYGGY